jgi:hypothetical protein
VRNRVSTISTIDSFPRKRVLREGVMFDPALSLHLIEEIKSDFVSESRLVALSWRGKRGESPDSWQSRTHPNPSRINAGPGFSCRWSVEASRVCPFALGPAAKQVSRSKLFDKVNGGMVFAPTLDVTHERL